MKLRISMMLSAPYSGATLFALILGRDPHICCNGETFSERLDQLCSCGKKQVDCQYFSTVAGHMKLKSREDWDRRLFRHAPLFTKNGFINRILSGYSVNPVIGTLQKSICAHPVFRKREQAFVDAHEQFIRASLNFNDASVFVDGSKIPRRAEVFADDGRFNLSVLHLVRDGRGFCNSFKKNTGQQDLAIAARRWMLELKKVRQFRSKYPNVPVLTVRYEDLCHRLVQALNEVRQFLGIPEGEAPDFGNDEEHHVIGNRMRHEFDGIIKEDLSWKDSIGRDSLARIERIMSKGLLKYGYL